MGIFTDSRLFLQYSKVQFVQMIPMNVDSLLSNANAL